MALWGPIQVNDHAIGHWYAQREPREPTGPDDLLQYRCSVETYEQVLTRSTSSPGPRSGLWEGVIQHRFGDGAVTLAAKVLGAASQAGVAVT